MISFPAVAFVWALVSITPDATCAEPATATWQLGFEAHEGYASDVSPVGAHVSLQGGEASILSGGAAEGEQFLRFVPLAEENALVVRMPEAVAAGGERSIGFFVRVTGAGGTARLVLSSGQTIGLQPVDGGVRVDVTGGQTGFVSLPDGGAGWLEVGLHESASAGTWDLTLAGQVVAADLPVLGELEALRDLLIFADGALDVDAVAVSTFATIAEAGTDQTTDGEPLVSEQTTTTEPDEKTDKAEAAQLRRQALMTAADLALAGDLTGAEEVLAGLVTARPGTARWHLRLGRQWTLVVRALVAAGQQDATGIVVTRALHHYQLVPGLTNEAVLRAQSYNASGVLYEDFVGDRESARTSYRAAVAAESRFSGAARKLERLEAAEGIDRQRSAVRQSEEK